MNNRLAMALAVGGGYVLGRSKKGKLALGLGGMVLGKRLKPQVLVRAANEQLLHNPQLKEVGDQVRKDLRGVSKAATEAVVTRRVDSLANSLHQRTLNVQDQLSGAVPDEARLDKRLGPHDEAEEAEQSSEDEQPPQDEQQEEPQRPQRREDGSERKQPDEGGREKHRPAPRSRKTAGKTAKVAGRPAPGKASTAKQRTTAGKTAAGRGVSGRMKGGEGRG
jgi:hypothetical protein